MTKLKQSILVIVVGLALAAGLSYAEWKSATANPPNENAPAPLNVSSTAQAKAGYLSIGTTENPTVSLNVKGSSKFSDTAQFFKNVIVSHGNVGIGTTGPAERLEVLGKTKTTFLQVTPSAGEGRVLTSDADGNASWRELPLSSTPPLVLCFDSGWIQIKQGDQTIAHDCDTLQTMVYIEGKKDDGTIHQKNYGTDGPAGLLWINKTEKTITIRRADGDPAWKRARVLMWEIFGSTRATLKQ